MDLVGLGYDEFTEAQRNIVEAAYPHPPQFAEDVLHPFTTALSIGLRPPSAPVLPMWWPIKTLISIARTFAAWCEIRDGQSKNN